MESTEKKLQQKQKVRSNKSNKICINTFARDAISGARRHQKQEPKMMKNREPERNGSAFYCAKPRRGGQTQARVAQKYSEEERSGKKK